MRVLATRFCFSFFLGGLGRLVLSCIRDGSMYGDPMEIPCFGKNITIRLIPSSKTNSSSLNMKGWKMNFPFGMVCFQCTTDKDPSKIHQKWVRREMGVQFAWNLSHNTIKHTLRGTITYPITSWYVWVDDSPNFPKSVGCILFSPFFSPGEQVQKIPSRELTYPPKTAFWRWLSFSQGGIC